MQRAIASGEISQLRGEGRVLRKVLRKPKEGLLFKKKIGFSSNFKACTGLRTELADPNKWCKETAR